ncbi:DUF3243 domain-containing protein [Paenibacillus sp. IB182496]|uniref:DUF3243 domain-containing protein n=1 Tax=Paenibacillus sabuli TaxID=2772509 RepID=A0A927GRF4_9BACL|nr:DUF3243 domain-containing protein [Paenibacillus sabuli]MBD2845221.1 DUF3243 domain-containing protein [Paenibacillus sabuli]
MSTVLTNFDTWKHFLADRVKQAEKIGLTEETIAKLAYEIGGFLGQKVDPQNAEERALKELWDVADETERQTLAHLMVKLVKHSN